MLASYLLSLEKGWTVLFEGMPSCVVVHLSFKNNYWSWHRVCSFHDIEENIEEAIVDWLKDSEAVIRRKQSECAKKTGASRSKDGFPDS